MIRMVRLTLWRPNELGTDVYISPLAIMVVHEVKSRVFEGETKTQLTLENGHRIYVKETPEETVAKIEGRRNVHANLVPQNDWLQKHDVNSGGNCRAKDCQYNSDFNPIHNDPDV